MNKLPKKIKPPQKRIIRDAFFCSLLLTTFVFFSPATTSRPKSFLIKESPKEVLDQVWQIIYRDYMDSNGKYNSKNWLILRQKLLANTYGDNDQAYEAIKGMLSTLDDPYTRFLDPKEFKQIRIDTSGELTGIGIQISVDEKTKDIIVISPIEGTPAFKAGLKAKDIIQTIDGKNTRGLSIDSVVKMIRGKVGSKVSIGILRGRRIIKYSLIREKIKISSVYSKIKETKYGKNIAYIRLRQFSANSAKEMRKEILDFETQDIDGYIVDLRSNPGGLLESSIEISRQFLNKGVIVSTKTKDGITDIRRAKGNALTVKPLALLVNEGSASASEIVSGAIQDNNRGILVGKKTFGKGLVQSVRPLVDGSGLAVTVAKYLTPNGTDIHRNGIKPDIKVDIKLPSNRKLTPNDLGGQLDNQYLTAEKALLLNINRRYINNKLSYNPNSANISEALNTNNNSKSY